MSITITAEQRTALVKNESIAQRDRGRVGFLDTRRVTHILMDEISSEERDLPSKLRNTQYRDLCIRAMQTIFCHVGIIVAPFLADNERDRESAAGLILAAYTGYIVSAIGISTISEKLGIPISPGQDLLAPLIISVLPAAFGLAGFCIEPAYNLISNTTVKATLAYRTRRVQSLVNKLEVFGSLPLEGSSLSLFLSEFSIPSRAYRDIVNKMNMSQLLELRKQSYLFNRSSQRFFTPDYLSAINALENINTLSNVEGTIHQLKLFMNNDSTVWEELVKTLDQKHFEKARDLLTGMGTEVFLSSDSEVSTFISKLRSSSNREGEVRLCAITSSKKRREISVKNSYLKEYEFFEDLLQEDLLRGEVELVLTVEEEAAFEPLFSFIQTKKINLSKPLARSMFILSERLRITDVAIICYNYLVKTREKFEFTEFFSSLFSCRRPSNLICFLFKYVETPFLIEQTKNLLFEDIKKAKIDQNYRLLDTLLKLGLEKRVVNLDREFHSHFDLKEWTRDSKLLDLIFKYGGFRKTQENAKECLLEELETSHAAEHSECDFRILHRCLDTPLRNIIDEKYRTLVNAKNFRQFWEYGRTNNLDYFMEDCKKFFKDSNEQLGIIRLWPYGQAPEELTSLLSVEAAEPI